jgi:hypothetical protein
MRLRVIVLCRQTDSLNMSVGSEKRASGRSRRVWYDDEADEDPMSESEQMQLAVMYSVEPEVSR